MTVFISSNLRNFGPTVTVIFVLQKVAKTLCKGYFHSSTFKAFTAFSSCCTSLRILITSVHTRIMFPDLIHFAHGNTNISNNEEMLIFQIN